MGAIVINDAVKGNVVTIIMNEAQRLWEEGDINPLDQDSMADVCAGLWRQAIISASELSEPWWHYACEKTVAFFGNHEDRVKRSNVAQRHCYHSSRYGDIYLYLLRVLEGEEPTYNVEIRTSHLNAYYETTDVKDAELRMTLLKIMANDMRKNT